MHGPFKVSDQDTNYWLQFKLFNSLVYEHGGTDTRIELDCTEFSLRQ